MEHIQSLFKSDAQYNKAISDIYKRAENQITKEINAELIRFADKENLSMDLAREKIKKFDVEAFQAKAKQYVSEKNFTARANEELRTYNVTMRTNRLELLKANLDLETVSAADEEYKLLYSRLNEEVFNEVTRQAGLLRTTVLSRDQLDRHAKAIVEQSFKGATFENRLWRSQADLQREIDKIIERTLIQGKSPKEGASDLMKYMHKSVANKRREAEGLAVTESARVQTESQKLAFEEFDVRIYEFIAETDDRTCEQCAELDGHLFNVSEMRPGENAAPMHPFCRCSVGGVI
ncbi:MAG TPA: minor capsid protein [Bacillota bacterium]|nr:minor capsid protein [Bacillota bacterium]